MAAITTEGHRSRQEPQPLWKRLLWFAALWGLGVATIAAVGLFIRTVVFS